MFVHYLDALLSSKNYKMDHYKGGCNEKHYEDANKLGIEQHVYKRSGLIVRKAILL